MGNFDPAAARGTRSRRSRRTSSCEVAATYTGGAPRRLASSTAAATRSCIHYGLCDLPEGGYQPRARRRPRRPLPQRRQGLRQRQQGHAFVRYVNRWRLERAEPEPEDGRQARRRRRRRSSSGSRSPCPDEYRRLRPRRHPRVEQGVREDRLPRRHRGRAAGETRTSTRRTSTTARSAGRPRRPGFAMGPIAGQPADRRDHRRRHHLRREHGPLLDTPGQRACSATRRPWSSRISPIKAAREGLGTDGPGGCGTARARPGRGTTEAAGLDATSDCTPSGTGLCSARPAMKHELGVAALAMRGRGRCRTAGRRSRRSEETDRPGDQGSDDARGRPHARPAAQLQGQHDAQERAAARHGRHPRARAWSAA